MAIWPINDTSWKLNKLLLLFLLLTFFFKCIAVKLHVGSLPFHSLTVPSISLLFLGGIHCYVLARVDSSTVGFSSILMHLKSYKGHSQVGSSVQILDSKRSGSKKAVSCWKNHTWMGRHGLSATYIHSLTSLTQQFRFNSHTAEAVTDRINSGRTHDSQLHLSDLKQLMCENLQIKKNEFELTLQKEYLSKSTGTSDFALVNKSFFWTGSFQWISWTCSLVHESNWISPSGSLVNNWLTHWLFWTCGIRYEHLE